MFDELRRSLITLNDSGERNEAYEAFQRPARLAVQVGFGKNHMRDAFLGELSCFTNRSRAVNRPLFSLPLMNLPRLFGKSTSDVFEILLDVVMNS